MGTPCCRSFKPTPHQVLTAKELVKRLENVNMMVSRNGDNVLEYLEGAYIWGKFHYGGVFKWEHKISHSKLRGFYVKDKDRWTVLSYYPKDNCCISDVSSEYFVRINNEHVAVWREDKLQWELVEQYREDEDELSH